MRGGAVTPVPSVDFFLQPKSEFRIFIPASDVQFLVVFLGTEETGEVLIGRICPRCKRQFWICRHCDRGHVYCGYGCSTQARAEKCRVYQKRYRRSLEGRLDHRDAQRAWRRQKSVGDQSSLFSKASARVSAPTRLSAWLAAMAAVGGEDTDHEEKHCTICGRPGVWVRFSDYGSKERRESSGRRLRL